MKLPETRKYKRLTQHIIGIVLVLMVSVACFILEIALESNDYKVWQAATGKEGLIMAANHPPELILLDIGLPDKSGHEILKELRAWFNKAIIILSVQNSETD